MRWFWRLWRPRAKPLIAPMSAPAIVDTHGNPLAGILRHKPHGAKGLIIHPLVHEQLADYIAHTGDGKLTNTMQVAEYEGLRLERNLRVPVKFVVWLDASGDAMSITPRPQP